MGVKGDRILPSEVHNEGSHWRIMVPMWIYKGHVNLKPRALSDRDFDYLASQYDLEPAMVKALCEVESCGNGFTDDGWPMVLFEAHWFSKLTERRWDTSCPNISTTKWNRQLYSRGKTADIRCKGEWARMREAMVLDRDAALQSASWGIAQVLGVNWQMCGFNAINDFLEAAHQSERSQLEIALRFIRGRGLVQRLQQKDWAGFSERYNGSGYRANRYDEKLKAAYEQNR